MLSHEHRMQPLLTLHARQIRALPLMTFPLQLMRPENLVSTTFAKRCNVKTSSISQHEKAASGMRRRRQRTYPGADGAHGAATCLFPRLAIAVTLSSPWREVSDRRSEVASKLLSLRDSTDTSQWCAHPELFAALAATASASRACFVFNYWIVIFPLCFRCGWSALTSCGGPACSSAVFLRVLEEGQPTLAYEPAHPHCCGPQDLEAGDRLKHRTRTTFAGWDENGQSGWVNEEEEEGCVLEASVNCTLNRVF
eukprot:3203521-Rhodomonas_salina.4